MNQVPWLRKGVGDSPADGGCVMQVIHWIHNTGWDDNPPCVDQVIRRVAIVLNDGLNDQKRQQLLGLAPKMIGTQQGPEHSCRLALAAAKHVQHIHHGRNNKRSTAAQAIQLAEQTLDRPGSTDTHRLFYLSQQVGDDARSVPPPYNYAAATIENATRMVYMLTVPAHDMVHHTAQHMGVAATALIEARRDPLTLLHAILDEHDRLTGRTQTPELDYTGICEAMATPAT